MPLPPPAWPSFILTFAAITSCLPQPAAAQQELPTVQVIGQPVADTPTEQRGGYAAPGASVATKLPASLRQTPQSVTVITRERIEDQNLHTLDAIMEYTPGVTVDLMGTGVIPSFHIRGYPAQYFQFDGLPMQTGGASWSQPDMTMFDHVEVLRGASGLFNGAGQPGGVINLVRKRPTSKQRFSASMQAGRWNAARLEADYSTPMNAQGTVRARMVAMHDERDSHVRYANSQQNSLYAVVEADWGVNTTVALGAGWQKRDWLPAMMGVPRFDDGGDLFLPRHTFLSTPWTHWDFESTQVFADMRHSFNDDWELKAAISTDHESSDLKYAFVSGPVQRAGGGAGMLRGGGNAYENRQKSLDAMLSGAFYAWGHRHEVVLGGNGYTRDARSRGGTLPQSWGEPINVWQFDPSAYPDPGALDWISDSLAHTRQWGLYAATRLKITEPLTLLLGGRVSWWKTDTHNLLTSAVTQNYRQHRRFTPYAALVYDVHPQWSLYASYADIFRVQSNLLDSNGQGMPPAIGANYEVGIKGEHWEGKLQTALAVFRIEDTNRAVAASPVITDNCCYAAQGKVQSQGLDGEISGHLTAAWQIALGYTYNHSKYKSDPAREGQIFSTFSPKHMLRLWSKYQLQGDWRAWDVGAGITAQSPIYSEGGNPPIRATQGGYAIASARVGWRISPQWSAAFNLSNLFDRRYYRRLGSGNFGPSNFGNVYGEPRNVQITLRTRF